ncbi:MAG: hypothetical protein IJG17_01105 [Eubacterium sp.]|nr:hypothetical protein [Eubacterium sp.]MBQ6363519.1 hypothetical protein [Lachnospiraceae bacterium]
MIRTFCQNEVREVRNLSGSGWTFSPCSGEHAGEIYPVVVPCCWESLPQFSAYRGVGRFTRHFSGEGNVRLIFQGVSHTATVYVDGKEVGTHYNAFTPFEIVLKDLPAGEHLLEVDADNQFSEKSALHIPNDYMSYGGISRGVQLEYLEDAFISWLHCVPEKAQDGSWAIKLSTKVVNLSDQPFKGQIRIEARNLAASCCLMVNIPAGESTEAQARIDGLTPDIWSPENPALYEIAATLWQEDTAVDDLIERIGFRTFEVKGRDLLLNGKKLRIKGFCRHEDHPMYCCALPIQAIQQDLEIIRDLGGNAVRCTHYPNDQLFLDLCDEQGVLVWEENHARGLTEEHMRNPNFEPQAERCIEEMIRAHINHPCIMIWGILNECASETEYGYECYKKQYELIRKLDPSRPRSSASCKFMTDICLGLPDIVSYNLYPEWYVDKTTQEWLDENYNWVQEESEGAGKPFLITEIGAGAIYGYHTPTHCKWSEEYQAEALSHQIKAVLGKEGCSGIFIWQFCDCRISFEWFASRPRTMNNKGVVDEYRRPKLSYEVVKELYHSYGNYFED